LKKETSNKSRQGKWK